LPGSGNTSTPKFLANRRRGRSLATIGVLACGVFLVVAVGANRQDPVGDVRDPATASRRSRESLQLAIYGLAWESEHGQPPDRLSLHFLESGEVGVSQATPARLEKARSQIATAASGIRAGQFQANPGPMRCGTCPFRTICPDAAT